MVLSVYFILCVGATIRRNAGISENAHFLHAKYFNYKTTNATKMNKMNLFVLKYIICFTIHGSLIKPMR